MKKINVKDIVLGLIAIFIYFFSSMIELLPFKIINLDIDTIPIICKTIYLIAYDILIMTIILLIFNKKITKDFEDILINHKKYYSTCIKYWLIGLAIMLISNTVNIFIVGSNVAGNEETIRSLFKITPLYIYFAATIYAPIVEELIFRQSIRNIFGRNILFIIISGLVFGGLHVLTSFESIFDLLYLIPYSALGISFAYMLYKFDNIFVSMGFHFMHNGILMAIQFIVLLFS